MSVRTVKTHADHQGVYAEIMDGDEKLSGAYVTVRSAGSWEAAKQEAIAMARRKLDELATFGPKPEPEEVPLEDTRGLRSV